MLSPSDVSRLHFHPPDTPRTGRAQFRMSDFVGSYATQVAEEFDPSLLPIPIPASLRLRDRTRPTDRTALSRVQIMIVGEALGENEDEEQEPFRGYTGALLRRFIKQAGWPVCPAMSSWPGVGPFYEVPNVLFDNVVEIRPTKNDLDSLPPGALEFYFDLLRRRLSHPACPLRPNVIVAVGGLAITALCGPEYEKITHWRGSLLETYFPGADGKPIKVIGTLHPSYVGRKKGHATSFWKLRYQIIADLKRALHESTHPEDKSTPAYEYVINPSVRDVEDFACLVKKTETEFVSKKLRMADWTWNRYTGSRYLRSNPAPYHLGYDLETHSPFIRCDGFSLDGRVGICIPRTHADLTPYWEDPLVQLRIHRALAAIYASLLPKVGQNCMTYDDFLLHWDGMPVAMKWGDTRYMWKCLQPELPASLQVLTSLYTYMRYYKEEGKRMIAGKLNRNFSESTFFTYNCKDAITPIEIALRIAADLEEVEIPHAVGIDGSRLTLWNTYVERYQRLGPALLLMSLRGVGFDELARQESLRTYISLRDLANARLKEMNGGEDLNVNSPKQLIGYLYGKLGLPKQFSGDQNEKTGEWKVSTDEGTILKLLDKYERKFGTQLREILHAKKVATKIKNDLKVEVDIDGNLRGSYPMGDETGRTASTENPNGTGRNMQNLERPDKAKIPEQNVRRFIIADRPGYVLLESDLRQAEALAVAWLANSPFLIRIFEEDRDGHSELAAMIFKCTVEQILAEKAAGNILKRQIGKTSRHLLGYGGGPGRLRETIYEDSEGKLKLSLAQAVEILKNAHGAAPEIVGTFHAWVISEQQKGMTLWTPSPFNRRRIFWGMQGDSGTQMEGFAQIPQSLIGDIATRGATLLVEDGYDVRMHTHDSNVCQVLADTETIVQTAAAMRRAMTTEITLTEIQPTAYPKPLRIPNDFKIGWNLGEMDEIKLKGETDEEMRTQIEKWLATHPEPQYERRSYYDGARVAELA